MSSDVFFKNKFKVCLAFLSIAAGLVLIAFFWNYNGAAFPYPWLGVFTGIAFLIGGFRLFSSIDDSIVSNNNELTKRHLDSFIENSVKMKINLEECEILTNNYVKESVKNEYHSSSILDLFYDNKTSNSNEQLSQSVLVFKKELNDGNLTYYSPVIYKDEHTLRFYMGMKKHTYIYLNKDNPESYFFDISFLEEEIK